MADKIIIARYFTACFIFRTATVKSLSGNIYFCFTKFLVPHLYVRLVNFRDTTKLDLPISKWDCLTAEYSLL